MNIELFCLFIIFFFEFFRQIIGSRIPARTLVSPIDTEFEHLLKTNSFKGVDALLEILVESFGHMSRNELTELHTPLSKFFFKVS